MRRLFPCPLTLKTSSIRRSPQCEVFSRQIRLSLGPHGNVSAGDTKGGVLIGMLGEKLTVAI